MPTIELLTTHTHRGAVYRPGAQLAVAALTARWLIARGIARLPAEHLAPEAAVAAVAPSRPRGRRLARGPLPVALGAGASGAEPAAEPAADDPTPGADPTPIPESGETEQ